MMLEPKGWPQRQLLVAVAGPLLTGVLLGLRQGPRAVVVLGAALPLLLVSVTALTTPMLYVGGAVLGLGTAAREVMHAAARALGALGRALLGLAPVQLFLAVTVTDRDEAFALGLLALFTALVIAVRRMHDELPAHGNVLARLGMVTGWAVVSMAIGVRLLLESVRAAGGMS